MLKEDIDGCSNAGGRMIDGRAKSVDARANARVCPGLATPLVVIGRY